jgi:hypothetical protein
MMTGVVNLSGCLTTHHAMKMYGGVKAEIHIFLTSPLATVTPYLKNSNDDRLCKVIPVLSKLRTRP